MEHQDYVDKLRRKFRNDYYEPRQFIYIFNLYEQAVDFVFRDNPEMRLQRRTLMAVDGIECLSAQAKEMTGEWKTALELVIFIASEWKDLETDLAGVISLRAKVWVLSVLGKREVCPDRKLGLQMLHIIQSWSVEPDDDLGLSMTLHLPYIARRINLKKNLLTSSKFSLAKPLNKVLFNLNQSGHLQELFKESIFQIDSLDVQDDVRCLSLLMETVTKKLYRICLKHSSGTLSAKEAMTGIEEAWELLMQLMIYNSNYKAFYRPGLSRIAAGVLVESVNHILAELKVLRRSFPARVKGMLKCIDNFFGFMARTEGSMSVITEIKWNRHASFERLRTRSSFFSLKNIPDLENLPQDQECPKVCPTECPKEFLDHVTQRIMENPVEILASRVRVDTSTFVYWMIKGFKISPKLFARRPQLKYRIQIWKIAGEQTESLCSRLCEAFWMSVIQIGLLYVVLYILRKYL